MKIMFVDTGAKKVLCHLATRGWLPAGQQLLVHCSLKPAGRVVCLSKLSGGLVDPTGMIVLYRNYFTLPYHNSIPSHLIIWAKTIYLLLHHRSYWKMTRGKNFPTQ